MHDYSGVQPLYIIDPSNCASDEPECNEVGLYVCIGEVAYMFLDLVGSILY